ncbi:LysR family transcriptional regulator [Amycolatopsis taiwanensis]|uniref:Transcriptional regulator n=1 Tax=Amycolatopsis taiwanensis TaxID=342230 RepID=A0A9W6R0A7_9PSEU|nr:LysR family transcriptional regulator [Amycolatopsis taiwanensis]GLY65185.1 transcriptional regulator [Amycolatopsis taiwanensis]
MEFRQLRYFLAIADQGSFNKAATQLLVSQPSLTRQMSALERQLGQPLFERTPRGVTLTSAGSALLGHARQLLALERSTREVIASTAPPREIVVIGVPPGVPEDWLVSLAERIQREVPRCDLNYREAGSTEQLLLLRQGRVDIGIVHQVPPSECFSKLLWQEPLGVAVRPRHPLAGNEGWRLADLDGVRVLVHSREQVPTQQDSLIAAASAADVRPQWIFQHFVAHARACAEAVRADAVLVGRHTASQQLPDWPWRPLAGLTLAMTTWLVRPVNTRTVVQNVADSVLAMAP